MPTVPPKSVVLITGGSGFIGAWVVRSAIDRGYPVVAAVRTDAQGRYLKDLYKDALSYLVVPDITKEGAYDDAVVGVSGIIHVASPAQWTIEDPWRDTINPAVEGTLGILRSAQKFGKDVKRVVITSSTVAANAVITELTAQAPFVFKGTIWNEVSPKVVEEQGKAVSAFDAYQASKSLSEKAAWKFMESEKPSFDLTTVLPTWTTGPWLHPIPSVDKVTSTLFYFYKTITSPTPPDGDVSGRRGDWVDVRDVALEHVLALEADGAGGKRLFGSSGNWAWQEFFDVVGQKNIVLPDGSEPAVKPGGKVNKADIRYDSGPARELFSEITRKSFETSVGDMLDQFVESGFLKRA